MMDRTGITQWLLAVMVIASTCVVIKADPACWDFNLGNSGWTNVLTNPMDWKFSAVNGNADDSSIPSFYYSTPYLYYQDQSTPPVTGSVYSPNIILQDGDQVTMVVFRHIIDSYLNDSSRPQLRFDDGVVSRNIEFSFNYDRWDTVTATCGTGYTICCTVYPCPGKFFLDGVAYIRDELIAVDSIEVAGGCSGSPTAAPTTAPPTPPPTLPPTTAPPPTTPPPTAPPSTTPPPTAPPAPAEWCCEFSTSVCHWSPEYDSDGWHWSAYHIPPAGTVPPSPDGGYLFVLDQTALLSSPVLTNIPSTATFTIDYYLEIGGPSNTLEIAFVNTNNYETVLGSFNAYNVWTTQYFACTGNCCYPNADPYATCTGVFYIKSINQPGDKLYAGISSFSVNGATCS